jgi:hypothetical protein
MSPRKKPAPPPAHIFRAFWPVVGEPVHTTKDLDELLAAAAQDMPTVAHRHRAHITGPGRGYLARGRDFPGAHGAAQVVVIEAPAVAMPPRNYHH